VLYQGPVMCWGKNDTGQLGNNSTSDSFVPVTLSGF
jgi:alpha-tubulin suppressor-like RCC1 family protein